MRREMQFRRPFFYPPFGVLANVLVQSQEMTEAAGWSADLGRFFAGGGVPGVRLLGPAAAPVSRLKRIYRFHLLLKAQRRSDLQHALRSLLQHAEEKGIPRKALVVDVDAISLM